MPELSSTLILDSLNATGEKLGPGVRLEVLIVGGAAAMLTGLVGPERSTSDVDVLSVVPSAADEELGAAAEAVARERGLPMDWMNRDAGLHRAGLPDGWETRRQPLGVFGRLHVFAASRRDLIAMKLYAHREQDLEDLAAIRPTPEELAFARGHFLAVREFWPNESGKFDNALMLIDHWGD